MNLRTPPLPSQARQDALEARFGLRVAAHLTEQNQTLPTDISERLRVAREQALHRARTARGAVTASSASTHGTWALTLGRGGDHTGWWVKLASALPLVALVAGLVLIDEWHGSNQISAAAEIDASLLADDLPPAAYHDPGFVEYLKSADD
jgi:hypothetical protein